MPTDWPLQDPTDHEDAVDLLDKEYEIEVEPELPLGEADIERLLRRIAHVRARLFDIDEEHSQMIERYDLWRDRVSEPLKRREAELVNLVSNWAEQRINANPQGPKTFDLPSGIISSSAGRDSVEVNENEFFSLGTEVVENFLHFPPPKPDKKAIKAALLDGEIIPGASLVSGERHFVVKTDLI